MQLRILRKPTYESCDGLRFDAFEVGRIYEVGPIVGSVLLAEGWAEPLQSSPSTATQTAARRKEPAACARATAIETLSSPARNVHSDVPTRAPDGDAGVERDKEERR